MHQVGDKVKSIKKKVTGTLKSIGKIGKRPSLSGGVHSSRDLASAMHSHPAGLLTTPPPLKATEDYDNAKRDQFVALLEVDNIDIDALRKLSWCGIPSEWRFEVWGLLTGYLSLSKSRRSEALARKRKDYLECVHQHSEILDAEDLESLSSALGTSKSITEFDIRMKRQIYMDAIRTCPGVYLFQSAWALGALQRVLYVWSVRHPASGYVQGLNDLVTPFISVFLLYALKNGMTVKELFGLKTDEIETLLQDIGKEVLSNIEADTYWCFSKLIDSIQDYYTFAQRGLQKTLMKLADIVQRVDSKLHTHLATVGVDYNHFAFRWLNCLLMRELPMPIVIRLWDTYLSEGETFPTLHVYVCATLLCSWSPKLQNMEFGECVTFLQNPPTGDMTSSQAEELLSQSYLHQSRFEGTLAHLKA